MKTIKSLLLLLIVPIFFLFSCISHRNLILIKEANSTLDTGISSKNPLLEYKVQKGDLLNIKISSTASQLEIINEALDNTSSTPLAYEASLYINGYIVNNDGDIELPLIGKVRVENLSLTEIDENIKERLNTYINYATVSTKLISYRISVLGEVTSPGTFMVYNPSINILQALAMVGDIKETGNRHKIKLIRKNEDGTLKVVKLDASKQSLIKSQYFYLYPNDVIYVEPLTAKVIRVNSPAIQATISLATLVFLILNFTKK